MPFDRMARLVIIGNSGAGKTTLARRVAQPSGRAVHHLDPIHREQHCVKRDASEAKLIVAEIASTDTWIIEGVFGWLAEVALPRATGLVWLDMPWEDCRHGVIRRGITHGMTEADQAHLLV